MDWFLILLAITTAVRGLGAGIIYDVAIVSLPVRRQIGTVSYAQYARANYKGSGVKTYASVSISGVLLTVAVTVWAFTAGEPSAVIWSAGASLAATVLAFFGTSRALPAMLSLRKTSDDEGKLTEILNRFACWHTFSTVWQVVSFLALIAAMAFYAI